MKTISCKLKTLIPALGLAGASILSGCKDKNEPQIVQPHDVVYEFGRDNFDAFSPSYNFIATLDSAEVTNVILQSDEKSWGYFGVSRIRFDIEQEILIFVKPEKMHKIKCRGTLYDVNINNQEDSAFLVNMGFKLENIVYEKQGTNQKQR